MSTPRKPAAPVGARTNFEPIRSQRLFEKVCEQIRNNLASGRLKPGDRLPPEREFAAELGVGRAAVREAFKTLEVSGLLELRMGKNGGAFVRPGEVNVLTRSLQDLIAVGRVSVHSVAEARRLIHEGMMRLACERARASDFRALENNLRLIDEYAAAGDLKRRAETAVDFFRLIAHATRNEALELLVNALAELIRVTVLDREPPAYRAELVPLRRRIVDALRARDAEAACAEMDHYLQVVHRSVMPPAKTKARSAAAATQAPAKRPAPRTAIAGKKAPAVAKKGAARRTLSTSG